MIASAARTPVSRRDKTVAIAFGAMMLGACGDCHCGSSRARPDASTRPAPIAVGTVTGRVVLAPGSELPFDARFNERQGAIAEGCTPFGESDFHPVHMSDARGLEGIAILAATDFPRAPEHAPVTHEVRIRDCRLSPRTIVGTIGDEILIRNDSDTPFFPGLGVTAFHQSLMPHQEKRMPLDRDGVTAINCGFATACTTVDIVVAAHPVHAVTGPNGEFTIRNFPAGHRIHLMAWHPLFEGPETVAIVAAGGTTRVEEFLMRTVASHPPPNRRDGGVATPPPNSPVFF